MRWMKDLMDIPEVRPFPRDAVQCNLCGGHGCGTCKKKGWFRKGHEHGRLCLRSGCAKPIRPDRMSIFCSDYCAREHAQGGMPCPSEP